MNINKLQTTLSAAAFYTGAIDGVATAPLIKALIDLNKSRGVIIPPALTQAIKDFDVRSPSARVTTFNPHGPKRGLDDEIPWASAAMCAWHEESSIPSPKSSSSRMWMNWGQRLRVPVIGCIAVIRRGPDPWQAHVGFWLAGDKNSSIIFGAIQTDRIGILEVPNSSILSFRAP